MNENMTGNNNPGEYDRFDTEFDEQLRKTAREMRTQMQPSDEVLAGTKKAGAEPVFAAPVTPFPKGRQARRRRGRSWGIFAAAAAAALVAVGGFAMFFHVVASITEPVSSAATTNETVSSAIPPSAAASDAAASGQAAPTSSSSSTEIVTPSSYDEVYASLSSQVFNVVITNPGLIEDSVTAPAPTAPDSGAGNSGSTGSSPSTSAPGSSADSSTSPSAPQSSAESPQADNSLSGSDFSQTNTQVAGVDEADIVKTDGKNIYSLYGNEIIIAAANGRDTKAIAIVPIDFGVAQDIYISNDRLVVILYGGNAYSSLYEPVTFAVIYDISDPSKPQLIDGFGQDGMLSDTRLVGSMLYVVSTYTVMGNLAEPDDPSTYVPNYYDGAVASTDDLQSMAQPVTTQDIRIMPDYSSAQFTIVAAIDVDKVERTSELSILGDTTTVYMNKDNLFLSAQVNDYYAPQVMPTVASEGQRQLKRIPFFPWEIISFLIDPDSWYTTTVPVYSDSQYPYTYTTPSSRISRIALNDGALNLAASTTVDGVLLNQFSLDEYNSYLRVALTKTEEVTTEHGMNFSTTTTTQLVTTNELLVFDSSLDVVGSLEDLAPGETIYSARFSGDVGYMVTFRQTDPLFSIDLSDPTHPLLMNDLKVTGFSQYLHPYADGLLLGLGQDATSNGSLSGYLKLSMFDVSDPFNISEAHKELIDAYYAEALTNHKALLIDAEKNIIGFEIESDVYAPNSPDSATGGTYDYRAAPTYMIYGYDNANGFTERAAILLPNFVQSTRGLYIGDYLYIVNGPSIGVFDLNTLDEIIWITAESQSAGSD